jgi:hypothetical protein
MRNQLAVMQQKKGQTRRTDASLQWHQNKSLATGYSRDKKLI